MEGVRSPVLKLAKKGRWIALLPAHVGISFGYADVAPVVNAQIRPLLAQAAADSWFALVIDQGAITGHRAVGSR